MSVKQLEGQNFQVSLILEVHVGSIIQSQQRKMKPPDKRSFWAQTEAKVQCWPALVVIAECVGVVFCFVGPCCRRILKEHKCSRPCWRIKRAADFTAFYGPFMMSAVRLTAGMLTQSYQWHLRAQCCSRLPSSSLGAFSSSFFKGESRSQSLPPFPAGIKGLSSTCDPGNTFTRPEQDRHGNRHSNLSLQALAPVRTLASSSSFYRWEVFVVRVGGASGVRCCCPEVVFCG